jgi:hypothetical protein
VNEPRPETIPPVYILGLDLGQSQDYTALAVLEKTWTADPNHSGSYLSHYGVRHLRRWQLGTSYTRIIADLGDLVRRPPLCNPLLVVDQTGVGAAVVDMVRQAQLPAALRPVLITAGHEAVQGDSGYHVPKKELASLLQVLLQSRGLRIAPMPERDLLGKELLAFRVKVTVAANETFEAWRERDHDDMVLAVALAAWVGERGAGPFVAPPLCGRPLGGAAGGGVSSWRERGLWGAGGTDRDRSIMDPEPESAQQRRGLFGRGRYR